MNRISTALLVLGLTLLQTACEKPPADEAAKPAAATPAATPNTPGLFTVSADQQSHLQIETVQKSSWTVSIRTTGTVDWDADHTTQAITQVNGPITRILVDQGQHVKQGDPLLYVSSPDVSTAISTYRKARNREDYNRRIVDRQKIMLDHGAIATKDYESAVADMNDAMTDVQTSLQQLKIFGHTKAEIDAAEGQGKTISPELALRAPIGGMIVQKLVNPGQLVQAGATNCFVISDISRVWVQGHIFDHDLPSVRLGDPVEETNPAFTKTFHGTISLIGAFVDPGTRTTTVRIATQNPEGLLKKDMFLNAVIRTSVKKDTLSLPVAAVLRDAQNEPIVYVAMEGGKFAQRSVTIGTQQDDKVEILTGLKEGEKVVANGSLFLQFANSYQ